MRSVGGWLDFEVQALLERGRIIPRVPDVVRARARARARAIVAVGASGEPTIAPVVVTRGRWVRLAVAASLVLVVGAAGAAVGLRGREPDRSEPAGSSSQRAVPDSRVTAPDRPLARPAIASQVLAKVKPRPGRSTRAQESYAAELGLLQSAQVAYTARNFAGAVVLVAEHARRFPNGRLAEEREALRVRSVARSGRIDEARRDMAAFAARFPRSVLLPRLREAAGSGE